MTQHPQIQAVLPPLPVLAEIVITAQSSREGFVLLERCFSNMCLQDDGWVIFSFFSFMVNPELSPRHWYLNEAATEDQKCFLLSKNKVFKKLELMIFYFYLCRETRLEAGNSI